MIAIANRQKRLRIPRKQVTALARKLLGARRTLSVAFVDDREMRKLNREFLRHDRTTDVLAFPLGDGVFGEVVICTGVAAREALERGIPVREELLRYLAHGVLHLLGYEDKTPAGRKRMWARQERELRKFLKT